MRHLTLRHVLLALAALALPACGGGGSSGGDGGGASWGVGALAESDESGDAFNLRFAMSPSGYAVMGWSSFTPGPGFDVVLNTYDPQRGWRQARSPQRNIESSAFPAPQLAIDNEGNAVAIWHERQLNLPGDPETFFASTYDIDTDQWSAPKAMDEDDSAKATHAAVAAGPGGTFWVIYALVDGSTLSIHTNMFTPGSGWSGPMPVENSMWDPTTFSGPDVEVHVDAGGNAIVAWERYVDSDRSGDIDRSNDNLHVFARRYDAANGTWSSVMPISPPDSPTSLWRIEPRRGGGAHIIWTQRDAVGTSGWSTPIDRGPGRGEQIWTHAEDTSFSDVHFEASGNGAILGRKGDAYVFARYTLAAGWTSLEAAQDNLATDASAGRINVTPQGDVFVSWQQELTTGDVAYARRFDAASGSWTPGVNLSPGTLGEARSPDVFSDPSGNAVVGWYTSQGAYAARYTQADGWGAAVEVDAEPTAVSRSLRHGVDASGRALAVWPQESTTGDIDVFFNTLR